MGCAGKLGQRAECIHAVSMCVHGRRKSGHQVSDLERGMFERRIRQGRVSATRNPAAFEITAAPLDTMLVLD